MGNRTSVLSWDNKDVWEATAAGEIMCTKFADPLLAVTYLSADTAKTNCANLRIFGLTNSVTWWSEARENLRFCKNLGILTLEECTAEIAADLGNLLLKGVWYQLQEITLDFVTDSNANGIPGSAFNALLDLFQNWDVVTEWAAWDMQNFEHGDEEPMCIKMILTKVPAPAKTRAFRA